jgi:Rrf2 family transcriptional regulator, iron-sulfur cluster assembly transcription factor
MMLTTRGRYAVMAIADIALNSNGRPISLQEVAGRQNIALSYLEQIFCKLKNLGVVKATRGPGGGYILSHEPAMIKISQIIDAVDEEIKITRCSGKDVGCVQKDAKCLTHDLWHGLGDNIRSYLSNISVEDLISGDIKSGDIR